MKINSRLIILGYLITNLLINTTVQAKSLQDVLNKALSENPEITSKLHYIKSKEEQNNINRSQHFPTIDLFASIGEEDRDKNPSNINVKNQTANTKEGSIVITQNLFNGFKTQHTINSSSYDIKKSHALLSSTMQEVTLKIIDAYLKSLEQKELLEISENNLILHKNMLAKIAQTSDQGLSRKSDLNQIEARLAKAEANVINNKNHLKDAQIIFKSLTGFMPEDLKSSQAWKLNMPATYNLALNDAISKNPNIMVSNYTVKIYEAEYKASKSKYFPSIDVSLKKSWQRDVDFTERNDNLSLALNINYNLFNGGSDKAQSAKLAHELNEKISEHKYTLQNVEKNLKIAWENIEFREKEREFLSKHRITTLEITKAYEEQFNLGKRTLLDLLNRKNELFKSDQALISVLYKQELSRYKVLAETGSLLSALNINPLKNK